MGLAAFDDFENVNVAAQHPQVAAELLARLHTHFKTDDDDALQSASSRTSPTAAFRFVSTLKVPLSNTTRCCPTPKTHAEETRGFHSVLATMNSTQVVGCGIDGQLVVVDYAVPSSPGLLYPYFVPGLPHAMLIELRQALISYQDYHMLLLGNRVWGAADSACSANPNPSGNGCGVPNTGIG